MVKNQIGNYLIEEILVTRRKGLMFAMVPESRACVCEKKRWLQHCKTRQHLTAPTSHLV